MRSEDTVGRVQAATVGRLGGDEFVVIADCLYDLESACAIAERIIRALTPSVPCAGRHVSVRASIGVALSGTHIRDADEILRHADLAMYAAKRRGEGGYQSFDPATVDVGAQPPV
jgi:diguanylate cyclase (GGDEF)-like protein